MEDCAICFESINQSTGKSVLACGHEFHMRCVSSWFQKQQEGQSCPCCRKETGEHDGIQIEDESSESSSSNDVDSDEEDEEDEEEEVSIQIVWQRDPVGNWYRTVRASVEPLTWLPGVGTPPEDLVETATYLQAVWRGHSVRSLIGAAKILVSLGN
jgi:hypothetical protein